MATQHGVQPTGSVRMLGATSPAYYLNRPAVFWRRTVYSRRGEATPDSAAVRTR
jgi:hypothetical protein